MAKIFCFGDSLTYGAWDISSSGWVSRLRMFLDKKQSADPDLYFLTYNLGICGETTDSLVNRFLPEMKARIKAGDDNVFIFAYGTNDSAFISSQNDFSVKADDFKKNLEKVNDLLPALKKTI